MATETKQLLTETEVSEAYGFTLSWLRSMRVRGGGIPFVKASRNVRYRPEDIDGYITANRVTSTTEAQHG
jgi:hypothetical protein